MNYHFIGIGGAGMSALAGYLLESGEVVSGSDCCESENTLRLQKNNALIYIGHNKSHIFGADRVIYTAAIQEDNEELIEARRSKIVLNRREELLGEIFNKYDYNVAIAGMHGKTTTTGMIISIFKYANLNPTYFLGGTLIDNDTNYEKKSTSICLTEACEYKRSFLKLSPSVSVILNIDVDHTDCYTDLNDIENAYNEFANNTKADGTLFVYDKYASLINRKSITFGEKSTSIFQAININSNNGKYSFDALYRGVFVSHIALNMFGRHNVINALAAFSVAFMTGISAKVIADSLNNYKGIKRRFTFHYINGLNIIEDYAHHPTQIKAVIASAKEINKEHLTVLFQPHTYSRTKSLMAEFTTCFKGADSVILLPVFSAREQVLEKGTSIDLYNSIKKYDATLDLIYCETLDKAAKIIRQKSKKDDLTLILGAGDVDKILKKL
ncbi:MAG: UDP-N-acetylmuramate--L-alanine ligase [Clostridia bacterium]